MVSWFGWRYTESDYFSVQCSAVSVSVVCNCAVVWTCSGPIQKMGTIVEVFLFALHCIVLVPLPWCVQT